MFTRDFVALEAMYHRKCFPKLCNRTRAADSTASGLDADANLHLHDIALAELVADMEDFCMEECVIPIFKLSDLAHMCKVCLAYWVLILKVTSTLPDLKSEYYLCSLMSGRICSGEMYFPHSLMILVMFLGRSVIMIVT